MSLCVQIWHHPKQNHSRYVIASTLHMQTKIEGFNVLSNSWPMTELSKG